MSAPVDEVSARDGYLGRVKVNEPIKDEGDVNEGGEHHIELLKA